MKKIYVLDTPARRPTRVAGAAAPREPRFSAMRAFEAYVNVRYERLRRYVRVGGACA